MTGRCCPRCGNELGVRDDMLCVGCANEQRGRCRWCGVNPPSAGGDLCTACARSGEIAIKAGSFTAAAETEHFGAELGTLPTSTDGDTHHRLVQAKPPAVRISAEQLGDLRDGHRLWLQTDLGEPVELAHGDLTEVQIEALAAGRAVTARIEVDRELCLATIALPQDAGMTEHRPPER